MEEYFCNSGGLVLNASFLDYPMPTSLDLLMTGLPPGRRQGLHLPLMPAVAKAASRAVGVRITRLPRNRGAVLEPLRLSLSGAT